jgi:diguanylate cyclase (GGDEF)-like protein
MMVAATTPRRAWFMCAIPGSELSRPYVSLRRQSVRRSSLRDADHASRTSAFRPMRLIASSMGDATGPVVDSGAVVMAVHESGADPVSAADLAAVSQAAGDVLVRVDPLGIVEASSDGFFRVGAPLVDAFMGPDAVAVAALLAASPQGPVWVRVGAAGATRWVGALSVPSEEGGWLLQLRDARTLDPTTHGPTNPSAVDAAAGAAGREQVLNEVAWLLSATPRTGKEIAVAACDLDDFAFINEEYGRDAGDEVLRVVTGRISDALRSGDLVARLEDDQFLVVLRGVHHLRGAIRVANKIRAAVEDPIAMPFGEIIQTASVGVTLISRGESVDSVLERAEGAMAMAKDAGRNTVMSSPPI